MKTSPKRAFDTISAALAGQADVRLVTTFFDKQVFGNFHVAYWRGQRAVSILLHRGQLFICEGLQAEKCRKMGDLLESDESEILEALRPEW